MNVEDLALLIRELLRRLAGGPVVARTIKQTSATLSSMEAEITAIKGHSANVFGSVAKRSRTKDWLESVLRIVVKYAG